MSDKTDVMDLIIDALRQHEKTLDGLIERLEKVVPLKECVNKY